MKRFITLIAALALMLTPLISEAKPKTHIIGFYNLENLFEG